MSAALPKQHQPKADMASKLVIVMVGLPARGKSYITKKLSRYLNWLQHDTKIFNVGNQRRKVVGRPLDPTVIDHSSVSTTGLEKAGHSAAFFDPNNTQAGQLRERVAMETLDELLEYLTCEDGTVAIFDATNSTIGRRTHIVERVRERAGQELLVLFLESQCFDEGVRRILPTF
jgi:6-phosphofructo-2-kinase